MDYKEKLRLAKEALESGSYDKDTIEYIFPELKESEDGKIRKELICFLETEIPQCNARDRYITWLEKQGEQESIVLKFREGDIIEYKSKQWTIIGVDLDNHCYDLSNDECVDFDTAHYAFKLIEQTSPDKVKPKFHEGEWVIDKQGVVHQIAKVIENITNHTYGYDIVGGGYFNDNTEGVRLWTIQDAKDGDVLVCESGERTLECLFIFKLIADREVHEYCSYRTIDKHFSLKDSFLGYVDNVYHPATQEQRDLLFQKMKEAGYEWDAEKKELRKIEQKSNNNQFTPEQADVLDKHIDKLIEKKSATDFSDLRTWKYIVDAVWTEKEGIGQYLDSLFTEEVAKKLQKRFGNIEQKSTDKATSTTFSYITPNQKFFQWIYDRLIYVHNENPDVDYMRSLKERIEDMQKPAWREEDEAMWAEIADLLWEGYKQSGSKFSWDDIRNWVNPKLKSLKERVGCEVNCTTTKEWSEEDEEMIEGLNNCLDELEEANGWRFTYVNNKDVELCEVRNWLKSLKERYAWKPSDEQIEALESAIENCAYSEYQDCLRELVGKLKKLREE